MLAQSLELYRFGSDLALWIGHLWKIWAIMLVYVLVSAAALWLAQHWSSHKWRAGTCLYLTVLACLGWTGGRDREPSSLLGKTVIVVGRLVGLFMIGIAVWIVTRAAE